MSSRSSVRTGHHIVAQGGIAVPGVLVTIPASGVVVRHRQPDLASHSYAEPALWPFCGGVCEWQVGCTRLRYGGSRSGYPESHVRVRSMIFRRIERWIAAVRAPLKIKLQFGFFLVIGVLLLMGVVSLLAIAEIREHAHQLDRLDESVHLALGVDHSIVLQEHMSSMFLLTKQERSEEHTSELQSQSNLVCRLLLEKKN